MSYIDIDGMRHIACQTPYGCRIGTIRQVILHKEGFESYYEIIWRFYGVQYSHRYSESDIKATFTDITLKSEDELYELL